MLTNTGIVGFILIIFLAIMIFGPKKLPQMGRAIGQTFTELKDSVRKSTSASDIEQNNRK